MPARGPSSAHVEAGSRRPAHVTCAQAGAAYAWRRLQGQGAAAGENAPANHKAEHAGGRNGRGHFRSDPRPQPCH
eukprot:1294133-Rhodomonas_salina.1